MTQEGQALPSSTPPENASEPGTTSSSADPPADTHGDAAEDRPEAQEKDGAEEGKQEKQIEGEEEETQTEGEENEGVKDEGEEGELKKDSAEEEHKQTKGEEGEGKDNKGVQQSADEEPVNPQQPGRSVHKPLHTLYTAEQMGTTSCQTRKNKLPLRCQNKHVFFSPHKL